MARDSAVGAINEFAWYYGFHPEALNAEAVVKAFMLDMERGLSGQSSGLKMLPSYLRPVSKVPSGERVLALDAGGTNLRAALVRFDENGRAVQEDVRKSQMPGTGGRLTRDEFYDRIADLASPILRDNSLIDKIGFCFSYPIQLTEDGDGILFSLSKEVDVPDVIGTHVGKELLNAFARHPDLKNRSLPNHVVLLNDTTSTLLCGISAIAPTTGIEGEDKWNVEGAPVIGFILGTGFNIAYPETVIPKINFNAGREAQIVVTEAGNFNFPHPGILDDEFDGTTKNPFTFRLEKAASGAYLGPLTLHILKKAIAERVIHCKRSDEIIGMNTLETRRLNEFMRFPLSKDGVFTSLFNDDGIDTLADITYLVSIITHRAALISACTLAGTIRHILRYNPMPKTFSPIRIAVDGTTFLIYKDMRSSLEHHLFNLLDGGAVPVAISTVENASLNGAAVAALSF
jgi:hexokinase